MSNNTHLWASHTAWPFVCSDLVNFLCVELWRTQRTKQRMKRDVGTEVLSVSLKLYYSSKGEELRNSMKLDENEISI